MSSYDLLKPGGKPLKLKQQSKDNEKERPPWRSVANVVPIKVNKNALLKAKILDATRRALLAQRITHTATQTDPFKLAVLMREKQTDIQKDLIGLEDKSMETDGAVTLRQECPGGFIITQTIGQMTEHISSKEIATQTPLPKVNLSFSLLNKNNRPLPVKQPKRTLDEKMYLNDQLLLQQMNALRKIDEKLKGQFNDEIYTNDSIDCSDQLYLFPKEVSKMDNNYGHQSLDYDPSSYNRLYESTSSRYNFTTLENLDAVEEHQKEGAQMMNTDYVEHGYAEEQGEDALDTEPRMQKTHAMEPTLTCWEDFEISDEDNDLPDLPRKTISEGSTPWNNFKDLVIGQRLANMRLSPIAPRPQTNSLRRAVTWNDGQQQAVTELLSEASALIDVFDQMSMILGPEVSLHPSPQTFAHNVAIPPSKWDPILTESCNLLEEKLRSFKPRSHLYPIVSKRQA